MHKHKFFTYQTFFDDLPVNLIICGICGYESVEMSIDYVSPEKTEV